MTKVIEKKDEGVNLSTKQKATSSKELASDQVKLKRLFLKKF